jgi:Domain of unknown function (DUF4407)
MDDLLRVLRSYRSTEAEPNPVARQALRDQLAWLAAEDARERPRMSDHPAEPPTARLLRVTLWAAGADPTLLAVCPADRARFKAMGAALIATSAVSAGVVAWTLHVVAMLPALIAVTAGAVWGCAILLLDRTFVSAMTERERRPSVETLVPRLVLSLVIAAVISTPLVLAMTKASVDARVVAERQHSNAERISLAEKRYRLEVADARARLQRIAREAHDRSVRTRRDLVSARDARRALRKAQLVHRRQLQEIRATETQPVTLLERLSAFRRLTDAHPELEAMSVAVVMLLIALDFLPIAAKVLGPITTYDRVLRVRLQSGLNSRALADLVRDLSDHEGVRTNALDHMACRISGAQEALAASALAEIRQRENAAFDQVIRAGPD